MRRGIAATALVATLALAATACGGDSGSGKADGPTTITWWDTSNATNEAATYQALVKEFEKANTGIKVKYVNVPFDQAQNKFDTAAGAKGAPDVLRSEVGWTPAFAKKGYFLPLDGTEALKDQAKFQPNLLKQAQFDGKTYGVPLVTDTLAFVYNKALFAKAGITKAPTTWDELKKDAAAVKSKDKVDGYWASTASTTTRSPSSTARAPTPSTSPGRSSPSPAPRRSRAWRPGRASSTVRVCTSPTSPPTPTPTSRTPLSTARSRRSSRVPGRSRTSTRVRPSRTRTTSASPPSRPVPPARRAHRPAVTTSPSTPVPTRPTRTRR